MPFPHVFKYFVIAKETFIAELAQWMSTAFYLLLGNRLVRSPRRGKMGCELARCIEDVFVREHMLTPDTYVAEQIEFFLKGQKI